MLQKQKGDHKSKQMRRENLVYDFKTDGCRLLC